MADDPRRHFRWWMVPALLALGLGTGFGIVMILFLARDDPDAKPVEDVIAEFESTTTSTPEDESGELRPPQGVYVLEGEGREAISFPPVHQDDGATMPATVSHDADGCWTFTIHFNEAHWQDWQLCPDGDRLFEVGGHTYQRWDFGVTPVENLTTFVCDPPALFAARGDDEVTSWTRSCDGTSDQVAGTTTSSGTLTFVGVERLEIGDQTVDAAHLRTENVLTGAQTGTDTSELWLAIEDGLPLRGERNAHIESDSPIGAVSYTEQGHWQLTSVVPSA